MTGVVPSAEGRSVEPEPTSPAAERRRAALELIEGHDAAFRRTARRYSLCATDAEDAYQRALEIVLTKAPAITGERLVRWMQTVTKHEALAVRRQRERMLSGTPANRDDAEPDPIESLESDGAEPSDRLERMERVVRSREALAALKPQEIRALTLKAEGYSYAEIGEITGWTYTKINRCMAEGRRRFLEVFSDIEAGRRCDALAADLSAFADGEARDEEASRVREHLAGCGHCRAKLRVFRGVPEKVLEAFPMGPALDESVGGRMHEWIVDRGDALVEKARMGAFKMSGAFQGSGESAGGLLAGTGQKVAAVCASGAVAGTCVATGVVGPGVIGEKPQAEKESKPQLEVVQPAVGPNSPAIETAAPSTPEPEPQTPAQQAAREFGIGDGSAANSGGEFGGPSGDGGAGGGGSGSGGGIGFEK
jgi:RNA polymerase sigma factor (sigma-70 family)